MWANFIQGFGIVVGVTAGVIAGTLVTVAIKYLENRKSEGQRNRNLKFEFDFNIKKIQSFKAELANYSQAVNGDALKTYHGYFGFSKLVYPTAQTMFTDGTLYKLFADSEDLVKLQKAFSFYNTDFEINYNQKIKEYTEICGTEEWVKIKPNIVANVRFDNDRFQEDIDTLQGFLKKLD